MEHIREQKITFYRDSNKETIQKEFKTLTQLLDFLSGIDGNFETIEEVEAWLKSGREGAEV